MYENTAHTILKIDDLFLNRNPGESDFFSIRRISRIHSIGSNILKNKKTGIFFLNVMGYPRIEPTYGVSLDSRVWRPSGRGS